jgi:hypothetical protein
MSLKASRLTLGLAVAATLASSAYAQLAISIGVRESGVSTVPIGGNGTAAGSIEFVNLDGQTLNADGQWHTFTWNFGTDPVSFFAGTQPAGGADNRLDGIWGALEHLRVRNTGGITDPIALYVDDLTNTPSGGSPVLFEDFESYAAVATPTNGAPEVVFRDPRFSGSTNTFLLPTDTGNVSSTEASSGLNSYRLGFQFVNNNAAAWIRMTTNNTATRPNPAIQISPGSTFSLRLKAVVTPVLLGWKLDADGSWNDANNWEGALPDSSSAIARFGTAVTTTAPRTVTVDTTVTANTLLFKSAQPYTIAAAAGQGILLRAPAGFTSQLSVEDGNHVISSGLEAGVALGINTSKATDSLTITGPLLVTDAETISLSKTGAGTATVNYVRFNALTVNGGTLKIAADGTDAGASEVNSISFAGGSAPTAKLDLTNNALVVDWDTAATTPRPNAIFSVRGRIVNGFNGGDWLGNGITSSTAAANTSFGLGYGDAAALGVTTFMGRAVDGEATLVLYTRKGDHDLDKDVDFNDLLVLAQNYDAAYDPTGPNGPKFWGQGDFTYDGIVNFNDLLSLAQNYGASALTGSELSALGTSFASDWNLALALAPEPASLSLIGGAAMVLRRRR